MLLFKIIFYKAIRMALEKQIIKNLIYNLGRFEGTGNSYGKKQQ